ncbi:MAG: flagellar biosynthetic protein FliO [Acidimicrobiales bacterium]
MTLAALLLTAIKAAAVFALLGVTVRMLKRIDHRRASSGGGPPRRGRRRSPALRRGPGGSHGRSFGPAVMGGRGRRGSGHGISGNSGNGGNGGNGVADAAGLAAAMAAAGSAMLRLRGPRSARRAPRALEIVERATLGRTSAVVLLRVHGHHVLLGVTDQQINVLRTVDPEPAIDLRHTAPEHRTSTDVTAGSANTDQDGTGRDSTGRDSTGRDVTGRDDTGWDGAGPESDARVWSECLPRPVRARKGRDHIELLDPSEFGPRATDHPVQRTDFPGDLA